jgi:hypothetical protein
MFIVDFIAGPGVGKSSLALGLASALMMTNRPFVVEYLPEFAKKLVWQNRGELLKNRFWSSTQQIEELDLLCAPLNNIDIVIFDGSLLLDVAYAEWQKDPELAEVERFVKPLYYRNKTITIQVERSPDIPYEATGRFQTREESCEIDKIIDSYREKWKIDVIKAHSSPLEVIRLADIISRLAEER